MTAIPASRVNYFDRQYLRLPEFKDEQSYHIALRRRHNLSHHGWGIVVGLEILVDEVAQLQPGVAIDGYGRELVLLDRQTIGRDRFELHGTSRLDVWLEYQLDPADAGPSSLVCAPGAPRQMYRMLEKARVVVQPAGAATIDGRRPDAVNMEDLNAILPDTPDDPGRRWPVYLGRVIMRVEQTGEVTYTVEAGGRPYVGLNAEIIDHPGNPARIELGHTSGAPGQTDTRSVGDDTFVYAGDPDRQFAVFVPPPQGTLNVQPKIAVTTKGTQILGATEVHGDLVLDGSSLLFHTSVTDADAGLDDHPAIYRALDGGDELRIDLGKFPQADRGLAIGLTKDGTFQSILEIKFDTTASKPTVTIYGDLRMTGTFTGTDIRLRTLSQDLIPQLFAMLQMGVLTGQT
jgi:hypothetical protein